MCNLIPMAEKTGMLGRIAAQGFENNHFYMPTPTTPSSVPDPTV